MTGLIIQNNKFVKNGLDHFGGTSQQNPALDLNFEVKFYIR